MAEYSHQTKIVLPLYSQIGLGPSKHLVNHCREESWYPQQLKPKKSHATVTVIAETNTTTATSGDVQLTIEQTDKSCANGNLQTENGDLHNKSETDQAAFMIEPQHNGYNNNKFVYAESETGSGM